MFPQFQKFGVSRFRGLLIAKSLSGTRDPVNFDYASGQHIEVTRHNGIASLSRRRHGFDSRTGRQIPNVRNGRFPERFGVNWLIFTAI